MEHLQLLNKADARSLVKRIKKAVIEAHDQIAQAGRWLIEFRDREGWKALGYDSWTHCIEEEFSTKHGGRRRVFKLIEHAEVAKNLENHDLSYSESTKFSANIGTGNTAGETLQSIPPAQTQHLAKLPPDEQRTALERAIEIGNGKSTEATVKKAVGEALKGVKPVKEIHRDETGYAIPEEIMDLWRRGDEVKASLSAISKARRALRAAFEKKDPLYFPCNVNGALTNLNTAYSQMQLAVPYAVCPICQGRARDTCASCKTRGIVSKLHFDTCVPEELKAIRAKSCLVL